MNTSTSDFCPLSPARITEVAVWITKDVLYKQTTVDWEIFMSWNFPAKQ